MKVKKDFYDGWKLCEKSKHSGFIVDHQPYITKKALISISNWYPEEFGSVTNKWCHHLILKLSIYNIWQPRER